MLSDMSSKILRQKPQGSSTSDQWTFRRCRPRFGTQHPPMTRQKTDLKHNTLELSTHETFDSLTATTVTAAVTAASTTALCQAQDHGQGDDSKAEASEQLHDWTRIRIVSDVSFSLSFIPLHNKIVGNFGGSTSAKAVILEPLWTAARPRHHESARIWSDFENTWCECEAALVRVKMDVETKQSGNSKTLMGWDWTGNIRRHLLSHTHVGLSLLLVLAADLDFNEQKINVDEWVLLWTFLLYFLYDGHFGLLLYNSKDVIMVESVFFVLASKCK